MLSFGCSIGDELATLKTLFPSARVHGCDADPLALEVAERTVGHLAAVFRSDADEAVRRGPFHLICAFSSLCINPAKPNLSDRFPFGQFADIIALFADALVPDGILALFNTNYLLAHTPSGSLFDVLRPDTVHRNGWVDVHTPEGQRFLRAQPTPASYAQVVEADAGLQDEWDLIDCLYIRRPAHASGARRVVPVEFYDPHDDLALTKVAEWVRSDLDSLPRERRDGYIDIRRVFRLFREQESARPWVEQEVWRGSIHGGGPIPTGTLGRSPVYESAGWI